MAKKLYEESNIYNIACALREKCGDGSKTYKTCDMADAIRALDAGGGGGGSIDKIEISGDCSYQFYKGRWDKIIDKISTKDITNAERMFEDSQSEFIPFDLNFTSQGNVRCEYMFYRCYNLKEIGKIKNFKPNIIRGMFCGCYDLRYLPEFENVDFSLFRNNNYGCAQLFSTCNSLREVPESLLKQLYTMYEKPSNVSYVPLYGSMFNGCCNLDEIVGLSPISANWTLDMFDDIFRSCYRVKNIIFDTQENGLPYTSNWANQIIDLSSSYVGYGYSSFNPPNYNSGITADKQVKDDATYQALKNDPDWWTRDVNYSRYNRISAIKTINSLPDTSAFLSVNGGTNTIEFKGEAGSLTDGGAINTMTEEEIAVAIAKGWTVSFS